MTRSAVLTSLWPLMTNDTQAYYEAVGKIWGRTLTT